MFPCVLSLWSHMDTHNSFKQQYETTPEKHYQPGKLTWALVPMDVRECQLCWLAISETLTLAIQTSNPISKANQMFSINHTQHNLSDQIEGPSYWAQKNTLIRKNIPRTQSSPSKKQPRVNSNNRPFLGMRRLGAIHASWVNPFVDVGKEMSF